MSSVRAAATAPSPPGERTPTPAHTRLRLVPPRPRGAHAGQAGRGVFALLVGLLLVAGLLALLLINTALAQGAFTSSTLQQRLGELSAQESMLAEQIAVASAPQALERRARALGMVRMRKPAFLDLRDGSVSGTPRRVRVPGLADGEPPGTSSDEIAAR